jgi:DNA-binding MarR family transcriptional regulator
VVKRHDNKGRSTVEARHVRLYHWLTNSAAWKALSAVERCSYIELAKRYDGMNNGFIALSCRDVADELGIHKTTASRAVRRLVELGFVEVIVPGGFSRKVLHATEYRLAEHKCDRSGQLASKAFMRWKPD